MELLHGETLTQINRGLSLIQKQGALAFGTDAFALAAFVRSVPGGAAADLGTGSGIVALLCAKASKFGSIDALERVPELASLAARNVENNALCGLVRIVQCDVRGYEGRGLDCVFSNPPYLRRGSGIENAHEFSNDARREHFGTIGDFAIAAGRSLRTGGRFCVVYRPERLCDLLCAMRDSGIEPKRLVPICHNPGRAPSLILCEGVRGGSPGMLVTRPLVLCRCDGSRTEDAAFMYERCELPEKFNKR